MSELGLEYGLIWGVEACDGVVRKMLFCSNENLNTCRFSANRKIKPFKLKSAWPFKLHFIFFSVLFMQRFSCIIGPNGSGKSNVIDSMLFVFGYRAQKIRSKKLSVLIHNSDEHKDIQSCSVEVHFQKIIDKVRDFDI